MVFLVSCFVSVLSLSHVLRSPEDVWHVLLNLKLRNDNTFTENYTLELVGNILETLWKYHWYTIVNVESWSTDNSSVTLKITLQSGESLSQQVTG
ncbi:hypothetical protein BDF20DRAFT_865100 [Mycotypha africana]|uniref:uncharacterized protein n=1 Tax=Mycotypha africana TaxID=64632 RepID=UPI0022FFCA93|nr:uncharacterized protein BDF20DRAFT_865100 [Mycotypha africana]KAI8982135.1 hypothetical protein BDF20DRAFT_865100 [Mycotypha africana]